MNKQILERAERVTRETIAPRASQYDVAGANPIESWRALWREGLLAGTVPTAHGGLGLDMRRSAGTSTRSCATASSSGAGGASPR